MKKILIILAFILIAAASFWAGMQFERFAKSPENSNVELKESSPDPFLSYKDDIVGKWSPIQMAEGTLTFQYGVCVHHTKSLGGGYVDREYPFTVEGNHLYLKNQYWGVHPEFTLDCVIRIWEENGIQYLEVQNVAGFSGKYKKTKKL